MLNSIEEQIALAKTKENEEKKIRSFLADAIRNSRDFREALLDKKNTSEVFGEIMEYYNYCWQRIDGITQGAKYFSKEDMYCRFWALVDIIKEKAEKFRLSGVDMSANAVDAFHDYFENYDNAHKMINDLYCGVIKGACRLPHMALVHPTEYYRKQPSGKPIAPLDAPMKSINEDAK